MCGLPDIGIARVAPVSERGSDVCLDRNGRLRGAFSGPLDCLLLGLPVPCPSLGSPIEAPPRNPGALGRTVSLVADRMEPGRAPCTPALDLSGHARRYPECFCDDGAVPPLGTTPSFSLGLSARARPPLAHYHPKYFPVFLQETSKKRTSTSPPGFPIHALILDQPGRPRTGPPSLRA